MTELKLYAIHYGVWFFVLFVLVALGKKEEDKISDTKFLIAVALFSLASFAIQWGLS